MGKTITDELTALYVKWGGSSENVKGNQTISEILNLITELVETDSGIIADGAVTTDKIADSAVTAAKLATGAVSERTLSNGAVSPYKLSDSARNRLLPPVTAENNGATLMVVGGEWALVQDGGTLAVSHMDDGETPPILPDPETTTEGN